MFEEDPACSSESDHRQATDGTLVLEPSTSARLARWQAWSNQRSAARQKVAGRGVIICCPSVKCIPLKARAPNWQLQRPVRHDTLSSSKRSASWSRTLRAVTRKPAERAPQPYIREDAHTSQARCHDQFSVARSQARRQHQRAASSGPCGTKRPASSHPNKMKKRRLRQSPRRTSTASTGPGSKMRLPY